MEVDDNPKCDKCGESIKAVAISHLRVCRMTNSAVPSFAFVQDVENNQILCLDCCESEPLISPYPVEDCMNVTLN